MLAAGAIKVFFSYAHPDEKLRDELAKHLRSLQRQGIISAWYDRQISPGAEYANEIDEHLNTAQVILLLVSPDFIDSDYCHDVEVKRAMERHRTGEARVIPVVLRPVDWRGAPFSKLRPLPKDAQPVTTWQNQDAAFLNVAQGIELAVKELASKRRSDPNLSGRKPAAPTERPSATPISKRVATPSTPSRVPSPPSKPRAKSQAVPLIAPLSWIGGGWLLAMLIGQMALSSQTDWSYSGSMALAGAVGGIINGFIVEYFLKWATPSHLRQALLPSWTWILAWTVGGAVVGGGVIGRAISNGTISGQDGGVLLFVAGSMVGATMFWLLRQNRS
ncbi:toll/interleukin-1 receptor domain-containing protein [Leptolyngbya sp. FACHB-261]|uniref:toll/interleukin-1 receptor domain-containing protein n=1 Tax=Leptolyngbya sp. FACHB-261 TaxID=2692806 RepID=UPI0016879554|nr:toll/interleukin-1 receptor domain-containing protein [Leptolyngbya sp. FACHB-261]MBD2102948.1 TIR domain-containing protein [Leptolyngbya sp. FACHB-261]